MVLIRQTMEFIDEGSFRVLYTVFIQPQLEYANVVWSPYLEKTISATENIQRRTAKLVPRLWRKCSQGFGLPYLS